MRTQKQIDAEIAELIRLRPLIPPRTAFGDSNIGAIDAQVRVLNTKMSEDKIYDRFDIEEDNFLLDSAFDAYAWLHEDDEAEAPSIGWQELVS